MKKALLYFIVILIQCHAFAQQVTSTEKITRKGRFELTFTQSGDRKVVEVECIYSSDGAQQQQYVVNVKFENEGNTDSFTFTMDKYLSNDVFVNEFNKNCKTAFKFEEPASTYSLDKIYLMLWDIQHIASPTPEAGTLKFNRGLMIYKTKKIRFDKSTYLSRKAELDKINAEVVQAEMNYRAAEEELKDFKENMKTKIKEKEKQLKNFGAYDSLNFNELIKIADTINTKIFSVTALGSRESNNAGTFNSILDELKRDLNSSNNFLTRGGNANDNGLNQSSPIVTNLDTMKENLTNAEEKKKNVYKKYHVENKESINQYCTIEKVELQFEKGFLEAIKVTAEVNGSELLFENIYAIGFSSINNFRRLANTRLFVRNGMADTDGYYIYVSDIFKNYDNRLKNFTRDYSPADTAFTISPDTATQIVLNKEIYINLIDAKVFTDIVGLNRTRPNGLVQIELSKRFNINTARLQVGKTRADVGWFNYIDLIGTISKIEQNNRDLILNNANIFENGVRVSPTYATNLDYLRHENYGVGVNVGVFLFDRPDQKFTAYFDVGIRYGHTIIADSVRTKPGNGTISKFFNEKLEAHTITFQLPKITLEFFPESRITPRFSWQMNTTRLFSNNQFKQVVSYEKSDPLNFVLEKRARVSNQYEVFVRIAPNRNRNSHTFLRWRFFTQFSDANTSFSQFQVGYAYNWTINR
jgi:hypothetical protein